jgi:hypothetical protein
MEQGMLSAASKKVRSKFSWFVYRLAYNSEPKMLPTPQLESDVLDERRNFTGIEEDLS